jgi:hypothetical protein
VPDILRNLTGLLPSTEPLAIFNHRNDDGDFEPIYRLANRAARPHQRSRVTQLAWFRYCEKKDNWPAGVQPMIFAKEEPPR